MRPGVLEFDNDYQMQTVLDLNFQKEEEEEEQEEEKREEDEMLHACAPPPSCHVYRLGRRFVSFLRLTHTYGLPWRLDTPSAAVAPDSEQVGRIGEASV